MTSLVDVVFRSLGRFYLGGNAFSDKFQILRPSDSTNPMVNVNTISSRFELNNADLKFLNSSNGETSTIGTSGITTPGSVLINGSNSATKFQVLNNSSGSVFSVNTETNETVADGDLFLRGTSQRTIRSSNDVRIQVPNQRIIRFHGTTTGGAGDPVIAINTGVYTLHPLNLTTTLGKSDAPWATTFTKQLDMDKFKILTTENLPNTVTNQVIYEPDVSSNTSGRFIIGNGTNQVLRFSKRVNSITTDLLMIRNDGSIFPGVGSTSTLGLVNNIWAELYVRDIKSTGNMASASANVTGDLTAKNITVGSVAGVGAILPSVDSGTTGTVDIGSPTKRFKNIYGNSIISSSLTPSRIIATDPNSKLVPVGTATNLTSLQYLDATSSIQDQLNGCLKLVGGSGNSMTGELYTPKIKLSNLDDLPYTFLEIESKSRHHYFEVDEEQRISIISNHGVIFGAQQYDDEVPQIIITSSTPFSDEYGIQITSGVRNPNVSISIGSDTSRFDNIYCKNIWSTGVIYTSYINASEIDCSGVITCQSLVQTSDRNLKKNIIETDLGLSFIESLKPVSYNYNEEDTENTHYGLIAQDVEEVLGDLGKEKTDFAGLLKTIKKDSKGNIEKETYSLGYTEFISPMIKAIQELSAIVKAQEQRIIELENKI